jgi:hypothetical protein
LCTDLDKVRVLKAARIEWLGDLVRMEEKSPCKMITTSQPEGSRNKGSSKLRWLDCVLRDVKLLKVEALVKESTRQEYLGEDHQGGQGP